MLLQLCSFDPIICHHFISKLEHQLLFIKKKVRASATCTGLFMLWAFKTLWYLGTSRAWEDSVVRIALRSYLIQVKWTLRSWVVVAAASVWLDCLVTVTRDITIQYHIVSLTPFTGLAPIMQMGTCMWRAPWLSNFRGGCLWSLIHLW